jgi:hypothetical protein
MGVKIVRSRSSITNLTVNFINFCSLVCIPVSYLSIYDTIAPVCLTYCCNNASHLMMLIKHIYVSS